MLKLYPEVPADGSYADWQRRLVDSVLLMVNGPHPAEHRVIAITWALVQHHAQVRAVWGSAGPGQDARRPSRPQVLGRCGAA